MSEELIIKAYELLEQKRAYGSLNSDEKVWVNEIFGTQEEYERMLSLSGIAHEEEDILAPSMTVESLLAKQFEEKHSGYQKDENKGFSLISLFTKPFFKIALPSLIVLLGITWFLNKEMQFEENVAVTEPIDQTEDRKTLENEKNKVLRSEPLKNGSDTRTNETLSGSLKENGKVQDEQLSSNASNEINLDINEDAQFREFNEDIANEKVEVIEKLEEVSERDIASDLEYREAEQTKNISLSEEYIDLDFAKGDNAVYTPQHDLNSATAPSANHNVFTWQDSSVTSVGTFTVQDASSEAVGKAISPVLVDDENIAMDDSYGNFYSADDAIGNSTLEPVSLDPEENSEYDKSLSANKDASSSSSASSSAIHDKSLFEFLYTTY